jgi:gliding motility-associated-like protein
MRIRSLLFIAACIVATMANAQKATSPTIGCAPLNVTFEAPAGAGTSFWTFGDGATSTLPTPGNLYTTPGTYKVVYRATSGGPPIGTPITVTVSAKPVPTITTASTLKGCVPLSVLLNGGATLPANVTLSGLKWSYGDGSPAGTTSPTPHTYVTPGKFTVTLEIQTSTPSCNVTKQFIDYISCSVPPTTNFTTTPSPATACVPPLTVTFTNNTTSALPLTHVWTMHDGSTFNGVTPAPVTITTNGNYLVTLVSKDTNNCSSTYKVPISIGKPTASFTVSDTVCINTPVTFTNTSSSGSYSWNFGSGATPGTSSSTNPVVVYNTPGLKTVTLDVTAGSCSGTTTKTIYVDDPKITFTYTPVYSCFEPVKVAFNSSCTSPVSTWNWSFGDPKNGTSTLEDPNYTYVIGDSIYTKRGMSVFKVTLNAITKAGCKVTATHNDTVFLDWARFVPDLYQGCAPLKVTFSDSSRSNTPREPITTWIWNYGDGSKIDTVTNKGPQVHLFNTPGTYFVQLTITNKNGCKDTSYKVKIQVGVVKPIDFTVDKTSICPDDSITFTNTTIDKTGFTGWHYFTTGELLSHCAGIDNIKHLFNDKTGPMDVTLTADYNGCMSTITKPALITVKGPIAKFDFHRDCAKKFEVELTNKSGDATDLKWDFGDNTKLDTVGTMTKITHVYAATGDYKVLLTAINSTSGCAESKDSVIIHIRNVKAKFTNDKLLCQGSNYPFDASASVDVNPYCYRGYTWEFSDTDKRPISTSDPKTPIAYFKNGVQTVSLIVEDINGCKDTAVTTIKVFKLKSSYTISDTSICIPSTVAFNPAASSADTTIASWKWYFGDGKTADLRYPGPGNTSNTYTNVTTPTVTSMLVLVDTLGCTDTLRKVIHIYTPTSKINIAPKTNICLGTELTFSADDYTAQGSNLKFDWTMGDGIGVFNNTNNFKYPYKSSGTFVVNLKFTENGSGCVGNLSQTINVQDYPRASFYVSSPSNTTVLCYPSVITFNDNSIVTPNSPINTYFWELAPGVTSTANTATNSYGKGSHTVKLTVSTSYGCSDDTTITYKVVGPEGNFTMNPTTAICRGELVTFTIKDTTDVYSYTWKFGDGSFTDNKSPVQHSYSYIPPSGKIVGSLVLYDKGKACSFPVPLEVFMKDVKADFKITDINKLLDSTICLGNEVLLSFSGKGDKYTWNLGDNNMSTDSIVKHTYTTPGDYFVSLITSNASIGCNDTIVKVVSILALPDITTSGDTICPNTSLATLHVKPDNGTMAYVWPTINNSTSANPIVVGPTKSQFYSVAGTDVNGCTSIDSAYLYVVPPISVIAFEKWIIVGDTVVLPIDNKNGTIKFTWTPTEGLSCLQCSNPWAQPIKDITYNVLMSDFKGCSTAPGKFIIHVKPETRIRVPTTFTPNGDGNNDIIYVKGWGIKSLVSFQIYNRWGELVFESSDLNVGWNGFYKDVLQNNDIYTYKVKATSFYGEAMEAEGHINLMR